MVVGDIPTGTEILVIGGGPGGYIAALRAAQLGKDVTLVESEELGGLCLNHGCIPSKALIHSAGFAHDLPNLAELGIRVTGFEADIAKMWEWRQGVIRQLRDGIAFQCKRIGVNVIRGVARFESPRRVKVELEGDVGVSVIDFQKCILATGTKPVVPPQIVVDGRVVFTAREALDLKEKPNRLAVIGGGYIGVELGMTYAVLGSKVSVIEMGSALLPGNDPEAVAVIEKRMRQLGIEILLNTKADALAVNGEVASLTLSTAEGGTRTLEADKVLVAVGHRPYTASLNLEKTQVKVNEKGFIVVDKQQRTSDPAIFAVGDVAGQPMLAHKAYAEGKVAAEVACGLDVEFESRFVPAVVYSDPEFAVVGLQENHAKEQNLPYKVGKFPFHALGRALTLSEPEGFCKVLIDPETRRLLGVEIVGIGASDLISEAALALEMGATADDVVLTIHPHPTLSEAFSEACADALGKRLHA